MEELQIRNIVHRASTNEAFRKELVSNTDAVIEREGLSPRVAEVVMRLVPHLKFGFKPIVLDNTWWRKISLLAHSSPGTLSKDQSGGTRGYYIEQYTFVLS